MHALIWQLRDEGGVGKWEAGVKHKYVCIGWTVGARSTCRHASAIVLPLKLALAMVPRPN